MISSRRLLGRKGFLELVVRIGKIFVRLFDPRHEGFAAYAVILHLLVQKTRQPHDARIDHNRRDHRRTHQQLHVVVP